MLSTSARSFAFAFAALVYLANTSSAQSLIGDEIDAAWDFFDYHDPHHFSVASGVDLNGNWGIGNSLDVEALSITIDLLDGVSAIVSGVTWSFLDLDFGSPLFTLASAAVTSNYADPGEYQLTKTADSVRVEFLTFVDLDGENDVFTINLGVRVPEPAIACQIALLSFGLVTVRRKK